MRSIPKLAVLLSLAACTGGESTSSATPVAASAAAVATPTSAVPSAAPSVPTPPTPPSAADGLDPCLLGRWRLTPEHATEFYRAVMGSAGAPVSGIEVEGESVATMNASGETSLDMSDVRVRYRMAASGAPMEMSLSLAGTGRASFTTSNGTITYSNSTNEFHGTMRVKIAGRERTMPWNSSVGESVGSPIRGTHTYRCSPTELVLTTANAPAPVTWVR